MPDWLSRRSTRRQRRASARARDERAADAAARTAAVESNWQPRVSSVVPQEVPIADCEKLRSSVLAGDIETLQAMAGSGSVMAADAEGEGDVPMAILAVQHDDDELALQLLSVLTKAGVDIDGADDRGDRALHIAAAAGRSLLVKGLLSAGAQVDSVNDRGETPLSRALAHPYLKVAKMLLRAGAKTTPDIARPPLYAVASNSRDNTVALDLLLSQGVNPKRPLRLNRSALMVAAMANNAAVFQALYAAGVDLNAKDSFGHTALIEAARAGANEVLAVIPADQIETEHRDKPGRTALLIAATARAANAETIKRLLGLGADRSAKTSDGDTAAALCRRAQRDDLLAALTGDTQVRPWFSDTEVDDAPRSIDIVQFESAEDYQWAAAVIARRQAERAEKARAEQAQRAAAASDAQAARVAVAAPIKKILSPDAWAAAFQRAVAAHDDANAAALLGEIPDGAPVDATWDGLTAHAPTPVGIINAWLQRRLPTATVSPPALIRVCGQAEVATGARHAAQADAEQWAYLIKHLVRAKGPDQKALDRALAWAIRRRGPAVVQAMLDAGANANAKDEGLTVLSLAIKSESPHLHGIVRRLLKAGADPSVANDGDRSTLDLATATGDQTLIHLLAQAEKTRPERPSPKGQTLALAAAEGNVDAVSKALRNGVDANINDERGNPVLLSAASARSAGALRRLLNAGADIDASGTQNLTALMVAAQQGRLDNVDLLVSQGANLRAKTIHGYTALTLAAAQWRTNVVQRLVEAEPALIALRDRGDGTALMAAAMYATSASPGRREDGLACTDALIEADVDVRAVNDEGQSAILLACGVHDESVALEQQEIIVAIIDRLIAAGADVNQRDYSGWAPIHAAAANGLPEVVSSLLAHGASRRARDRNGNSPNDLAIAQRHDAVIEALRAG